MQIVISTPTGNVGRAAVDRLLEADADVEVVVVHREPARLAHLEARGVYVRQGSLDNVEALTRATGGADALLWVTPTVPTAANLRASQNRFGVAVAAAVRANAIPRVVNLSSIGAQHDAGTGPIAGLHDVEEMLDATGADVLHLRAGYFFENYLPQVQVIRAMGAIMLPVAGEHALPMIGTRDIGVVAADMLLDDGWAGREIHGLHGPEDLTFDDAAAAISAAVGRTIGHNEIDELQARMGLSMLGLSNSVIEAMLEMYHAIDTGHLVPAEPRTPETTTPTTLGGWAAEAMAPKLA
jgi:uncharacterized protein YbjT (DUF2867 family)